MDINTRVQAATRTAADPAWLARAMQQMATVVEGLPPRQQADKPPGPRSCAIYTTVDSDTAARVHAYAEACNCTCSRLLRDCIARDLQQYAVPQEEILGQVRAEWTVIQTEAARLRLERG